MSTIQSKKGNIERSFVHPLFSQKTTHDLRKEIEALAARVSRTDLAEEFEKVADRYGLDFLDTLEAMRSHVRACLLSKIGTEHKPALLQFFHHGKDIPRSGLLPICHRTLEVFSAFDSAAIADDRATILDVAKVRVIHEALQRFLHSFDHQTENSFPELKSLLNQALDTLRLGVLVYDPADPRTILPMATLLLNEIMLPEALDKKYGGHEQ